MRKIWIVRERLDWHNADPYDVTIAYSTKELAEAGLIERIEDVKKYFRENDYELFDDMTKIESDYGRMVTERDDWYCCWIEEIDMFNEYNMSEVIKTVSGEGTTTATTAKEMKADFLNRVEKMYDFVKGMGEDLKIKRFFSILDEMTEIAREIDEKGLLEDEQMFDVWELIMTFDDSVQNDMAIGNAREYLETRLSSIIKTLQGENVVSYGQNCSDLD